MLARERIIAVLHPLVPLHNRPITGGEAYGQPLTKIIVVLDVRILINVRPGWGLPVVAFIHLVLWSQSFPYTFASPRDMLSGDGAAVAEQTVST